MFGYSKSQAAVIDWTCGFSDRKSALAAAKERYKAQGIPGRHRIYIFATDDNDNPLLDTKKDHDFLLNPRCVQVPEETIEELLLQCRADSGADDNDITFKANRLFVKVVSVLYNYKLRIKTIRPEARKIHLELRDTFSIEDENGNRINMEKGDNLCVSDEYVGDGRICEKCLEEFIKLDALIKSGKKLVFKPRKSVLIIDSDENNVEQIKEIFKDKDIVLSVSRARTINDSRSKAQLLLPDLTLINADLVNSMSLAQELRINDLKVVMYGIPNAQNESYCLPFPTTLSEYKTFVDRVMEAFDE